MSSYLRVFDYEDNQVRTVLRDGEPWFVLKDVCAVLGIQNATDVAKRLDEDEVTRFNLGGLSGTTNIVSEAGLYSVILRSDKAEARRFKRWITHEVLPCIRRTGMYATVEAAERLMNDPDFLIGALTEIKTVRARNAALERRSAAQTRLIAEMKPKAAYYDVILACPDAVAISVIAKDYGWSAIRMNSYLHERGVQFKQSSIWLLYQKHAGHGYTCTRTHEHVGQGGEPRATVHTYWTQKGRLFLYDLLKAHGILPLVEREVTA